MTGKTVYKDMVRFWGKAVRHQFRAGRGHRHHHGVPVRHQLGLLLALRRRYFRYAAGHRGFDGLFLESTFIGLFFFGWDRLSKVQHLVVTWLVAWVPICRRCGS